MGVYLIPKLIYLDQIPLGNYEENCYKLTNKILIKVIITVHKQYVMIGQSKKEFDFANSKSWLVFIGSYSIVYAFCRKV